MMETVIDVSGLKNYLGGHWVHSGVDFSVRRGEIVAIAGGSGSGKTTLLRSILMLLRPSAGVVKVFGHDLMKADEEVMYRVRRRWGMLFQQGALFSSLTVLENVMFPLRTFTKMSEEMCKEIATLKLGLVGISPQDGLKLPAQLSGGMQKRVAAARAIALDPELIFLDEPTAGLDPHSADALDALVKDLRDTLGLTIVLVTHDLDTLWHITDRVGFLGEGKLLAMLPMPELVHSDHPVIQDYFKGPRGQVKR